MNHVSSPSSAMLENVFEIRMLKTRSALRERLLLEEKHASASQNGGAIPPPTVIFLCISLARALLSQATSQYLPSVLSL
jgi:hypothetical protein